MENGPFEDVFPIENGDIPASYVGLLKGINQGFENCTIAIVKLVSR